MSARRTRRLPPLSAVPATAYLAALLLLPIGTLLLYSFYESVFFGVEHTLTLESYRAALTDDLYRTLLLRSVVTALLVCTFTIPIAYAVAYAITFHVKRRVLVLVLLMAPLFASYVVRVFAWVLILGPTGFVNRGLHELGTINEPLRFLLYGRFAVTLALTTILIPLAMLPIYAALQNVPRDLINASRDLGESRLPTFARVTFPLTAPAVSASFVFVFLLAGADYLTPQLLGGSSGFLIGRAIADQFGPGGDIPLGGALSFVTLLALALVIVAVLLAARVVGRLARRLDDRLSAARARRGTRAASAARRAHPYFGLHLLLGGVGIVLYAPLAVVVLMSFSNSSALQSAHFCHSTGTARSSTRPASRARSASVSSSRRSAWSARSSSALRQRSRSQGGASGLVPSSSGSPVSRCSCPASSSGSRSSQRSGRSDTCPGSCPPRWLMFG